MNDDFLKDTNNDRCQTAKSESIHLEGDGTLAKGKSSHSEGSDTAAYGDFSHVEGYKTTAIGCASHAEGCRSHAKNNFAHAEGNYNLAKGVTSHAEGYWTKANAFASHTEGQGTIAENCYEHAQGAFNISNNGDDDGMRTLFSIGNGLSYDKRSNAVEVMQNGDMYIVGIGGFDGKNYKEAKTLQESIGKGKCYDTSELRNDAYRFFNSLMAVIDHIQKVSDKINTFIDMSVIEAIFKNYSAAFGFTAKVEDTYVKLTYKGIEVVAFITHNDKREADVKAFIDEMTASTMNMPRIVERYLNLAK